MPEKAKEKKVQKKKSMEKQERRRIKDFFDRIAPSTMQDMIRLQILCASNAKSAGQSVVRISITSRQEMKRK